MSTVQAHRGLLVFQEDRFQPSSGLVDGGEDVAVSLKRSGQGPHYVQMNVGEIAVGDQNRMDGCCWLSGNFGSVPMLAVSTLAGNIRGHATPDYLGRQKSPGRSDARVGYEVSS